MVEPKDHLSSVSYGDTDDRISAEEGHIGQTDSLDVIEKRRTLVEQNKTSIQARDKSTSFQIKRESTLIDTK